MLAFSPRLSPPLSSHFEENARSFEARRPGRPQCCPKSLAKDGAAPRYRPGFAPAAALRGRNPHHPPGQRPRWADGADRSHGDGLRSAVAPAPPVAGAGGRRHGQLRAAVFQLLPLAPEDHGGGQPLAHSGRGQGGLLGAADAAPGVPAGGGRITRSPHARLPHHRRAASALPAARRGQRPGACGFIGHPAAGGGASSCHVSRPKWPPALVGIARGAHFFAPPHAGCGPVHPGRPQPPRLAAPESRGVAGAATLATPVPP